MSVPTAASQDRANFPKFQRRQTATHPSRGTRAVCRPRLLEKMHSSARRNGACGTHRETFDFRQCFRHGRGSAECRAGALPIQAVLTHTKLLSSKVRARLDFLIEQWASKSFDE